LLAVQAEDVGDDAVEPPVPAGLAELTAAQEAGRRDVLAERGRAVAEVQWRRCGWAIASALV
jgi:hypothetical protein